MDHTLVPHDATGRAESDTTLFTGEHLRKGTIELLKDLGQTHELWIYTTSFRSQWMLKVSFWLKGVKIKRVINEQDHDNMIRHYTFNMRPSKYPKHFGIDVHVDDSVGVLEEGNAFGFKVIQIDPLDPEWTTTIRNRLNDIGI